MTVQELVRLLMAMPMNSEVRVQDPKTSSSRLVVDATEAGRNNVVIHTYTPENEDD